MSAPVIMASPRPRIVGLHCPACGKRMLRTLDTRPVYAGVRRRKACVSCGFRFTTVERLAGVGQGKRGAR